MVELNVMPGRGRLTDEQQQPRRQQQQAAGHRHRRRSSRAAGKTSAPGRSPMITVGHDLTPSPSIGQPAWRAGSSRCRACVHAIAIEVISTMVIVRITPISPHDVERRSGPRVVARRCTRRSTGGTGASLQARQGGRRPCAPSWSATERGPPAGGIGVGGVGLQPAAWRLAAHEAAEKPGSVTTNCTRPVQQAARPGVGPAADDVEIVGVVMAAT